MATNKHTSDKDPEKTVDVPPYGSRNPDPISDQPGSHPVETGIGAALGGIASGAAVGMVGGPVGAVIGGIIGGAVGGGLAGKGVGELIDPTTEDNWLREYHESDTHKTHVAAGPAHVVAGATHETYRPALRYGLESAKTLHSTTGTTTGTSTSSHTSTTGTTGGSTGAAAVRKFQDVEHDLKAGWDKTAHKANLSWDQAKGAVRHAYDKATSGAVQLREEQLHVSKDKVQTGSVGLRKEVITEHKTVSVPVEREEIVIERRAVHGAANAGDIKAEEIRIPVSEERVHVTKDAVVTGEVSIGKRKVTETETVGADLKKEEVKVEHTGDVKVRDTGTTTKITDKK